jgi:hypothetical protein
MDHTFRPPAALTFEQVHGFACFPAQDIVLKLAYNVIIFRDNVATAAMNQSCSEDTYITQGLLTWSKQYSLGSFYLGLGLETV